MAGKRKVLKGYRQHGKRFVPPFLEYMNLSEVTWLDDLVPELIWLGLLNTIFEPKRAAELGVGLARAAAACVPKSIGAFAFISEYGMLKAKEKECVVSRLAKSGSLDHLADAIRGLVAHYPECPLGFLAASAPDEGQDQADLARIKQLLLDLSDRHATLATWTQAHAIYIYFLNDKLKVFSDTSLADFPAIEDYPDTEASLRVAASVRAAINGISGTSIPSDEWKNYFWNRGRSLGQCE